MNQALHEKKFILILEEAHPIEQAQIIKGVFKKFPVSSFPKYEQETKQKLYDEYQEILHRIESSGCCISGEFKNIIFAANGPKPEIVLSDATRNKIKIIRNEEYCLVYDRPLPDKGLLWDELVDWWVDREHLSDYNRSQQCHELFNRLLLSLKGNKPEKILFDTYYRFFIKKLENKLPALIPQVYLHYDPYSLRYLKIIKRLPRQRMDFLLLLPHNKSIVIEIDGKQHYSDSNGRADPQLYAEMVAEDRNIKLSGYEIYRFGGHEFSNFTQARQTIIDFFINLFEMYSVG